MLFNLLGSNIVVHGVEIILEGKITLEHSECFLLLVCRNPTVVFQQKADVSLYGSR